MTGSGSSSAVIFDNTPPLPNHAVDGSLPGLKDLRFSNERSLYSTQWTASSDPESDLELTQVALFLKR